VCRSRFCSVSGLTTEHSICRYLAPCSKHGPYMSEAYCPSGTISTSAKLWFVILALSFCNFVCMSNWVYHASCLHSPTYQSLARPSRGSSAGLSLIVRFGRSRNYFYTEIVPARAQESVHMESFRLRFLFKWYPISG